MKKYTIKEDLDEMERCKLLLKKSEIVQQSYVKLEINWYPQVFKNAVSIFREKEAYQNELIP